MTRNRAAPGLWMSFAAVLGLIAALKTPPPANALEDAGLTHQKA
jgi:predicted membrane metal-binding protein